jgi:uncharacterized membrane protein
MAASIKPYRIASLDLLRALAAVMMVQGHTIDVLLSDEYRSNDYWSFTLWQFERGLTAPIFLLTSGTVFIYLLRSIALPLYANPRAIKGIRRSLLLIALGYLLRLPSSTIIGLFSTPAEYWPPFWIVDVLQLIGVGLLLLLFGAYLSEKFRLNDYAVFGCGGFFFFLYSIFCEQVNWTKWLIGPIAAYFYTGSGSHFPLFPWAGYMMLGGVLGAYLAHTDQLAKPIGLSWRLAAVGIVLLVLYNCGQWLKAAGYCTEYFPASKPELILLRLGSVLLVVALIVLISSRVHTLSPMLSSLGQSTLLIYLTHLVLLYGSPWNTGLNRLCDKCLPLWPALSAALLMLTVMIALAALFSKIEFIKLWTSSTLQKLTSRQQTQKTHQLLHKEGNDT